MQYILNNTYEAQDQKNYLLKLADYVYKNFL